MDSSEGKINILMLPFLAHGHISPFFELAKQLTKRNFNIFICSTPINLGSIKNKISVEDSSTSSIQLVELYLPPIPDLPPHHHTTNGLPTHLMATLRSAFELAGPAFSKILNTLKPDLLIYDFQPSWAAEIASSHNIPCVYFQTTATAASSLAFHFLKNPGKEFPFPYLFPQSDRGPELNADLAKVLNNFVACLENSCDIILAKTFRELEGKYIDFLSVSSGKTMITVGPLVQEPIGKYEDPRTENILNWLNKKDKSSVVFVCFGSEQFLSDEELEEVANGLELSKVNFIWAVRFPEGQRTWDLPEGFVERVQERGLVVEGWAPQASILEHSSTGGFVSHCGWSSLMESMKFGVPVIAMPMKADQPLNAKLVVEVGMGMEIARDKNGKVYREEIAEVIRKVVVEKSGEAVRRKARALSEGMTEKGEEEIDRAAEELVKICSKKK